MAVQPPDAVLLNWAPASMSILTASAWPFSAAQISAVVFPEPGQITGMPSATHLRLAFRSPLPAAFRNSSLNSVADFADFVAFIAKNGTKYERSSHPIIGRKTRAEAFASVRVVRFLASLNR